MLDQIWIPRLAKFLARGCGEFRPQREQLLQGSARRVTFAQLRTYHRERKVCAPEAGHVDFERGVMSGAIVALTIRVEDRRKPVPTWMMGIQFPGALRPGAAALPIAGIGRQETLVGGSVTVHRIERDGSIGGIAESLQFATVEKDGGQGMIGEVIGRRGFDRAPSCRERPWKWIGLGVEPVNILFHVK